MYKISQGATQDEIKQSYHRLALKTHPDKATQQKTQFSLIKQAYDILSDDQQRLAYDERLTQGLEEDDNGENHCPIERSYCLISDPYVFNHYEFIK